MKKSRLKFKTPICTLKNQSVTNDYLEKLEKHLKSIQLEETYTVQTLYNNLENCLLESMKTDKQVEKRKLYNILTEETLSLIKQRHKLQNLKHKSREDKIKLSYIYKITNKNIRKDYKRHRLKTIEEYVMTSGSCKRAYKELRSHKTWIPSLLENSSPSNNRENILKIATKFYQNLYDQKDLGNFETINFYSQNQTNIDWNDTEIDKEIKRLKSDKSPGPDGIPNEALKLARTLLTPVITYLFNIINKEQRVPEQWTKSNIVLLYKKGDPKDIGNYRPISLLPSLYKLFSQCILSRISAKIDRNQPIEQAGFRRGYSTVHHIQALENIIEKYKEFQKPIWPIGAEGEQHRRHLL
ncbi:unnamed protein product [Parnassius mnemosyne]|uniref:Reverse transcriptase domain-containing protein n=1 Tax=Parnassius mnemosyne TaxID=213953 RepID=A0AAV1KJ86_9NEOP